MSVGTTNLRPAVGEEVQGRALVSPKAMELQYSSECGGFSSLDLTELSELVPQLWSFSAVL